jgi:FAD/FMN-containing dehydrogenase
MRWIHRRPLTPPDPRLAIAQLGAIFPEYEVCDFGHIAAGGVHFNLVPRVPAGDNPSRVAALRDHVLEMAVRDFGASFSGKHGIGRADQAAYDVLPRWPYRNIRRPLPLFLRAYRRLRSASGRWNARGEI